MEDKAQFDGILAEYIATYNPQHRDELDLLTEAVFCKWRQQRLWLAETSQMEVAIAQNERELQMKLPRANAQAHLANGIAKSEQILKLYLRYDAQFHRHYRNCLKELRDLQAQRAAQPEKPSEPKPPTSETEIPAPSEPNLTPEAAQTLAKQAEIRRLMHLNLGRQSPEPKKN